MKKEPNDKTKDAIEDSRSGNVEPVSGPEEATGKTPKITKIPKYMLGGIEGNNLKSIAAHLINDGTTGDDGLADVCLKVLDRLGKLTKAPEKEDPQTVMWAIKAIEAQVAAGTPFPKPQERLLAIREIIRKVTG